MKTLAAAVFIIIFSFNSFPQNDYIPSEHPVYEFLNMLSTKGILENYQDEVLPLTRKEITDFLIRSASESDHLSQTERDLIEKYLQRFDIAKDIVSLTDGNLSSLFDDTEKRLYLFKDSIANLSVNPIIDVSMTYSGSNEKTAYLFNFGGKAYGSYRDWLGFSVRATNGIVKGDRDAALQDVRVKNSFTFNNTRINYFDETTGHLAIHYDILDFQFGRERVLWGNGSLTKLVLSENPPAIDFLKLKLAYKKLSYQFLHGWLVQPPEEQYIDSVSGTIKTKQPKYIAANRLGVNFPGVVNFGISQVIIYSNRPVEAAYLNPFLLWESAQRSMNDLDNSFLVLDSEVKITNGLTLSGSYIFDDINFNFFENWNDASNRSAWQLSSFLAYPFMPENIFLKIDYSQVRPYTFSHSGVEEALTYTTNGYMLGYPYHPNSGLFRIGLDYYTTQNLKIRMLYEYFLHGRNKISQNGNVTENFGGDVMVFYRYFDPEKAFLFGGELENQHTFILALDYEFLRNYSIGFTGTYSSLSIAGETESEFSFAAALKLFYE